MAEVVLFASTGKKASKYECPADFVSFCHKPCSSTLTQSLKNNKNELWLIKAPASFDPEWWVQSFAPSTVSSSLTLMHHQNTFTRGRVCSAVITLAANLHLKANGE